MSAPYRRTAAQRAGDFEQARAWETEVAEQFRAGTFRSAFNSTDDLDFWFPGVFLELKEKRQSYTQRWWLLPNVPERDLFIIDELTVKRALQHYPAVLFLIRDVPGGRLFYVPIWELVSVERARVNRVKKGKWVIDLSHFRTINDPVQAYDLFVQEMASQRWKDSSVASHKEVPQA